MDKILNLDSVDLYNKLYGLETLNPLVSVIDLNKATSSVDLIRFNYGIYALYLKLEKACDIIIRKIAINDQFYTGLQPTSLYNIEYTPKLIARKTTAYANMKKRK